MQTSEINSKYRVHSLVLEMKFLMRMYDLAILSTDTHVHKCHQKHTTMNFISSSAIISRNVCPLLLSVHCGSQSVKEDAVANTVVVLLCQFCCR
jgi:hypothetical protein